MGSDKSLTYPTLYSLWSEGITMSYKTMHRVISEHWGDTWPSDDYTALEVALKETLNGKAQN